MTNSNIYTIQLFPTSHHPWNECKCLFLMVVGCFLPPPCYHLQRQAHMLVFDGSWLSFIIIIPPPLKMSMHACFQWWLVVPHQYHPSLLKDDHKSLYFCNPFCSPYHALIISQYLFMGIPFPFVIAHDYLLMYILKTMEKWSTLTFDTLPLQTCQIQVNPVWTNHISGQCRWFLYQASHSQSPPSFSWYA